MCERLALSSCLKMLRPRVERATCVDHKSSTITSTPLQQLPSYKALVRWWNPVAYMPPRVVCTFSPSYLSALMIGRRDRDQITCLPHRISTCHDFLNNNNKTDFYSAVVYVTLLLKSAGEQ